MAWSWQSEDKSSKHYLSPESLDTNPECSMLSTVYLEINVHMCTHLNFMGKYSSLPFIPQDYHHNGDI
ncbi:hypothetical protein BCON_0096g00140 [Botryotinia convoluta]|uniref:Uncharacterized protein n=1 Tax=Botryotinia convoluta TaxID=54673 RepID=A0A4Z1I0Z2_9HELO|nr:hypothetical protein BCON_0096g00140 [Botryotinia convoluta]